MKKKFNINGQEIMGEEVEFETEKEAWNSYILHDGTRLKLKSVVSSIIRLDMHKPDGDPVYYVNSSNIASADVPDNLKKKQDL